MRNDRGEGNQKQYQWREQRQTEVLVRSESSLEQMFGKPYPSQNPATESRHYVFPQKFQNQGTDDENDVSGFAINSWFKAFQRR